LPYFTLRCESDGSKAYLNIPTGKGATCTIEELKEHLKQNHVIFGIDNSVVEEIVAGKLEGENIVVASCKPMRPGNNGRLEWFVDLTKTGKPREMEDGRVDHRDLQKDTNVRPGDRLLRHIPPKSGIPGTTIFGTPILPPKVADVDIQGGSGTERAEGEPDLIVASITGAVFFDGKIIEVHNQKIIDGDIDYATGNVSFNGNLRINGIVRAGFCVKTTGNLMISGGIEDAEIECGGSAVITEGAVGSGNSSITCKGSLRIHHCAHFTINTEKNISIIEDAVHSVIKCEGEVRAGAIIGGSVVANSIIAGTVGNSAEIRTVLDVARLKHLNRERYSLLKQFGVLSAARVEKYESMFSLVHGGMNDDGFLNEEDQQTLESLKQSTLESLKNSDAIQKRIERINELENEYNGESTIKARMVFPNTLIKLANAERIIKQIEEKLTLISSL
jgi:uncharacterized protein (DUF342 family)